MDFLYFVPQSVTEPPSELAYAFDKPPIAAQVIGRGPSGGPGTIFAGGSYHQEIHRVKVSSGQTWQHYPGTDLHIGYYTDELPGPDDLARKSQITGRVITLGDGKQWTVPIARACYQLPNGQLAPICSLPTTMKLNDNREWVSGDVVKQYADLYHIAERWWEFLMQALAETPDEGESLEVNITQAEAAAWCSVALRTNYRITDVEISILELLNDATRPEILNVLVDLETWHERLKKKELSQSENMNSCVGSVG